jgi:hypothetical protein
MRDSMCFHTIPEEPTPEQCRGCGKRLVGGRNTAPAAAPPNSPASFVFCPGCAPQRVPDTHRLAISTTFLRVPDVEGRCDLFHHLPLDVIQAPENSIVGHRGGKRSQEHAVARQPWAGHKYRIPAPPLMPPTQLDPSMSPRLPCWAAAARLLNFFSPRLFAPPSRFACPASLADPAYVRQNK